jgi:hypothetical protein
MNCRECEEWLQESLDVGNVPMTADATAHLADCESCRRNVAAARVLLDGISQLSRPETSRLMTSSIAAAVAADKIERKRRSTYRWASTAVLAASILMLFGFGAFSSFFRSQPTVVAVVPVVPNMPEKPAEQLARGAEDAQNAVRSLSRSMAESTKSRFNALLAESKARVASLPPPQAKEELDPAAQSLKNAGLNMAQTFEPVTISTARALDFFAREIPYVDFSKN